MRFNQIVLVLLLGVISLKLRAQFADPRHYLVDSIDYNAMEGNDQKMLDSLLVRYHASVSDTQRMNVLVLITDEVWNDNVWIKYNKLLLAQAEQNVKADQFASEKARLVSMKALSSAYGNEGYVAGQTGDVERCLAYFHKSLKIDEELGEKEGIASALNNIGFMYLNQENHDKALEYFLRSLSIYEELDLKVGIAGCTNNISLIYQSKKAYDEALIYLEKAKKVYQETGNKRGLATAINNIGVIHSTRKDFVKAVACFEQALSIRKLLDDKDGMTYSYNSLSGIAALNNQVEKAVAYSDLAMKFSQELGYPKIIRNSARQHCKVLKLKLEQPNTSLVEKLSIWKELYESEQLYIAMRDSVHSAETEIIALKQNLNYEHEREKLEIKKEQEKMDAVAAERSKHQLIIIGLSLMGLLIVAYLAINIFQKLKITKQQKIDIEAQKLIVDQKQTEILDSINYAKRIQQALLKSEDHITEHLPEHFILFKPKDVVSGDFYWNMEKQNYWYATVSDCTGHGVPGAFMSMLGMAFLNEINAVKDLLTPAEIMNQVSDRVVKELSQTGKEGESRDGMDMSLFRLNLETNEMVWAGANNPLYLVTRKQDLKGSVRVTEENGWFLHEISGDKRPIGYHFEMRPFTDHVIQLDKGDTIYIFSDGYPDQFGGPRGKKFKYKPFKNKLIEFSAKPFSLQKEMLDRCFEAWRGNIEQIDDVCIIGVKV